MKLVESGLKALNKPESTPIDTCRYSGVDSSNWTSTWY